MENEHTLTAEPHEQEEDPLSEGTILEQIEIPSSLNGRILVVKLGGSTLEHQKMVLADLIYFQKLGLRPVLVHGGGPSINTMLEALHILTHFEHGLRVTDAETLLLRSSTMLP